MVPGSSPSLDVTMTLGGSIDYSDCGVSCSGMILRPQCGPLWPRPQLSSRSLVIAKDTDINRDHTCGRATDPDIVLNRSPGPDVTMALGGKPALHISLLLATLPSSGLPLSTGYTPFCPSLFRAHHTWAHHDGAQPLVQGGPGWGK